mmetsp:Transcript_107892/g.186050  ORF Transcript_107892/g.186050 Transcript_107892/m.186050 type:complete len:108 (+) Transcript_107892:754-1077(+)
MQVLFVVQSSQRFWGATTTMTRNQCRTSEAKSLPLPAEEQYVYTPDVHSNHTFVSSQHYGSNWEPPLDHPNPQTQSNPGINASCAAQHSLEDLVEAKFTLPGEWRRG